MPVKNRLKQIKRELTKKIPKTEELVQIKKEDLLSSGYTPLDVHASGRIEGGYGKGLYIFIVGDSSSGKTWLSQTCLAEASIRENFEDYEFYYDNIERGMLINTRKFFGDAVANRLRPPKRDKEGNAAYSETIQDLYYTLDTLLKKGKRFIYIVDSMDGLDTDEDVKKFDEMKDAHEKGKKTTGSYGMSKAKANSVGMKRIIPRLEKSGSILIVISQTRDNIGFGFETKTRSGGKSLKFYAHLELWTSVIKKLKKTVLGKPRHVGNLVQVDIKKNRLNGWEGKLTMPFYKGLGIDNTGGCVDYLVEEKHWKKGNGGIKAVEFDVVLEREKLIRHIESNDLERKLKLLVKKTYHEIQEACIPKRKKRYQ